VVDDFVVAGRLMAVSTPLPNMTRQCYLVVHQDKSATPALQRFMAEAALFAKLHGVLAEHN